MTVLFLPLISVADIKGRNISFDDAEVLLLDVPVDIEFSTATPGQEWYYVFTAPESGMFTFFGNNETAYMGYTLYFEGDIIAETTAGYNRNNRVTTSLIADGKYYLTVRYSMASREGYLNDYRLIVRKTQDWHYEMNEKDEAVITSYNGSASDVNIPAEFNGYPVTAIGDFAFSNLSALNSVTIPETVRIIGKGAFIECKNLFEVIILDSVIYVEGYVFSECASLSSVNIPDGITRINSNTFYGWP